MRPFRAPFVRTSLLAVLCSVYACNLDNLGDPPPRGDIYMPTALALSQQSADSPPRYLYLVNSNFDLRYNGGSLQAFDLDKLDSAVAGCKIPGPDCTIATDDILTDEVLVPSLTTSLAISPDHSRLYVAARTDATVLYVDLDETAERDNDVLKCDDTDRRCSASHTRGDDATSNPERLRFPEEPVGMVSFPAAEIYAQPDSELDAMSFLMVAHRPGYVSLFLDAPSDGPKSKYPLLIDVKSGLDQEPTGIAFDPVTRLAYLSVYARLSSSIGSKVLVRAGLAPEADPESVFVYDAGLLSLDGLAKQRDTRDITMNPTRPGQALVLSNQPSALLFADVAATQAGLAPPSSAPVRSLIDIGAGAPSRIALGALGSRSIAAVSCFDAQKVFIVDAARAELLTVIHNLNGPFELAIDSARKRLYVADFRASVVRVLDLQYVADAGASDRTDVPVIATLGFPKVVMELQ